MQEQRDGHSRMSLVVNRGRAVANLDSRLYVGETLVAQANGNYAIFKPRSRQADA